MSIFFTATARGCARYSDADEAQKIADHYQRIINSIEGQIDQQGGWWPQAVL